MAITSSCPSRVWLPECTHWLDRSYLDHATPSHLPPLFFFFFFFQLSRYYNDVKSSLSPILSLCDIRSDLLDKLRFGGLSPIVLTTNTLFYLKLYLWSPDAVHWPSYEFNVPKKLCGVTPSVKCDSIRKTRSAGIVTKLVVVVVVAFSSRARILGECSTSHSPPALFFFYVEISSRTLIPLFRPGSVHSGSARCLRLLWPNGPWRVACQLVSPQIPTLCLDSDIVNPLRFCWVKGICVFRCNLPAVLYAEWPGSFTCHWGNTRVERTPNKSQHTKLTLEKKILPPLLPGFELATFRSRVRRSDQQAVPAPQVVHWESGHKAAVTSNSPFRVWLP